MHFFKFISAALLLVCFQLEASTIQGKVIGVADGDTLTLLDTQKTQHKVRLQGIDAPEKAQAFGSKSKQSLSELVHGKHVSVEYQKKDKYNRLVGKVLVGSTDVCLEQIKLGMAWHYKQYSKEQPKEDIETYTRAENQAKLDLIGLWRDKSPTPPWEFRRQQK